MKWFTLIAFVALGVNLMIAVGDGNWHAFLGWVTASLSAIAYESKGT